MSEKVTDAEISEAFAGTNFGRSDYRRLLEQGVLKTWAGYASGHTLTTIMQSMGLTTARHHVTKRGRRFAFDAFYQREHSA